MVIIIFQMEYIKYVNFNLNYCISCERPADSPTTPFKKKYSCYEGIVCDLCQYCYYCESFGHDCNIRCMSCNKKMFIFQKRLTR